MALPRIQYIDAGPAPQGASISAATAPGRALASVGGAIENTGQNLMAVAGQVREAQESKDRSEFMRKVSEDSAKFHNELLTRTDFKDWGDSYKDLSEGWRGDVDSLGLSPQGKAILNEQLGQFTTRNYTDLLQSSALKDVNEARALAGQTIDSGLKADDQDTVDRGISELKRTGLTQSEENKIRENTEKFREDYSIQRLILSDPKGAREKINDPDFKKKTEPSQWEGYDDALRKTERKVAYDANAQFEDMLASGKPVGPADLERLFPQASPALRLKFKERLDESTTAEEKAMRASPEYQNQVIGEAAAMINGYNFEAEDFDTSLADISSLVAQVQDPGQKRMLTERFESVRSGQKAVLDSNAKIAEAALNDAYKAGRFGDASSTGEAKMATRAAIDDGLLTDPDKLARAGFSKDQVEQLTDTKLKPYVREQLYRTLFHQRTAEDKLTPFERSAYLAVRNGDREFSVIDPEAADTAIQRKKEADAKFGSAWTQIQSFAKANPNASKTDFENEVYRLAGEEARKTMQQSIVPPLPGSNLQSGPPGAFNGTPVKPAGKSLTEVVKNFEAGGAKQGFFPQAYWDYGQWSIGYGTKGKEGETITKQEAESRLDSELSTHRARVEKIAAKANLKLSENEVDALTSFDFNTGEVERLLAGGKRSKAEIADAMLLYRNATQGGKLVRLRGLENRRKAERELFLNGYD